MDFSGHRNAGPRGRALLDCRKWQGLFSRVFLLSEYDVRVDDCEVVIASDESALLDAFFAWFEEHDPDLILGWNVVNFDLDYLQNKCKELRRPFAFGRGGEGAAILAPSMLDGPRVARLPGRVALDGIELLRAAFWSFESFTLENVAHELLGRGKNIEYDGSPVDAINRLYAEDRAAWLPTTLRIVVLLRTSSNTPV